MSTETTVNQKVEYPVNIPVTAFGSPTRNYEWLKTAQGFYIQDTNGNYISIKVK